MYCAKMYTGPLEVQVKSSREVIKHLKNDIQVILCQYVLTL